MIPRRPTEVHGSVGSLGAELDRLDTDLMLHRHARAELTPDEVTDRALGALAVATRIAEYVRSAQLPHAVLALQAGAPVDAIAEALDRSPDQVRDELTVYVDVEEAIFRHDDRYGFSPARAAEVRALIDRDRTS